MSRPPRTAPRKIFSLSPMDAEGFRAKALGGAMELFGSENLAGWMSAAVVPLAQEVLAGRLAIPECPDRPVRGAWAGLPVFRVNMPAARHAILARAARKALVPMSWLVENLATEATRRAQELTEAAR